MVFASPATAIPLEEELPTGRVGAVYVHGEVPPLPGWEWRRMRHHLRQEQILWWGPLPNQSCTTIVGRQNDETTGQGRHHQSKETREAYESFRRSIQAGSGSFGNLVVKG
eukprot:scaffold41145_cov183-Amphora_coffeaeformis.AAC.1